MKRKDYGVKPYKACQYQLGTDDEHLIPVPKGHSRNGQIKEYEKKNYCDTRCAARHRYPQPPDRFCECGEVIPHEDKNGERLKPSQYKAIKTCGDRKCIQAAIHRGTKKPKPKAKKPSNKWWSQTPDIIESWCLGGERTEPGGTGPIAIESMKQMMNSAINPRPWYGQEIQGA